MSAIKAKFTKNVKGESEVNCLGVSNPLYGYDTLTSSDEGLYDAMPRESNGNLYKLHDGDFKNALKNGDYTNFDNPIYNNKDGNKNYEADTASVSTRGSTAMFFTPKGDNRKKWYIIGGAVLLACLVIIIVAATVGATAKKDKLRERVVASESTGSDTYSGSMRLTEKTFTEAYNDPSSSEYIMLKEDFEKSMDSVMGNSGTKSSYSGTTVTGFQPGSIIVLYVITLNDAAGMSEGVLSDIIEKDVAENGGRFGEFEVDVNSIAITANVPTEKPTVTTTVIPEISCQHPIIDECKSVLSYSTSRRPIDSQKQMKDLLLSIANRTAGCYDDSKFYMCAFIAPHCYDEGTTRDFLLPCRQTCDTYSRQCKEVLEGVDHQGALECQALFPYSSTINRCAYKGTPPTEFTTPQPNPSEHVDMCYPIHHSYCSNIPWHSASLPNYRNHTTIEQVYEYLSFIQALTDSGLQCHEDLHTLMCGTLLPKCGDDKQRIPPCKSFCQTVVSNCSVMLGALPVNVPIDCNMFHTDEDCTRAGPRTSPATCDSGTEYTCMDQNQCIALGDRCNGFPNCNDGSDEVGCADVAQICTEEEFKCVNTGQCVRKSWQCDNYNDCGDGSDEVGCECTAEKFACFSQDGTPRCIDPEKQCDGYFNCFNKADEQNCDNFTCVAGQFTCGNGLCRPTRFICDGDDDCGDMSDERNCLANEVCAEGEFKCVNGSRAWGMSLTACMPMAWRCDAERDCSDTSDEKDCPSFCDPNPCSHQGNCTADPGGYRCVCPEGTSGSNCQIVENLPEISCNTPISIAACQAPLAPHYNFTIASPFSQAQISNEITLAIPKFSECYEHAAEFLCTYAVPECGSLSFPAFPCKSMCREFTARCAHKLNESVAIERLIDCDSLADDHVNPEAQCFSLEHTLPTIAPITNDTTAGCEDLKLPYCDGVGYAKTYFPNYFNQTHQNEAQWMMNQIEHAQTSMPNCNPYLKEFGCSVVAPKCNADETGKVPPCRELCEAVEFDCGYWMDHMQWTFPFKCDDFPRQNETAACIPLPTPTPHVGCYSDQFQCDSGECLHKRLLCDDYVDCNDGSDEFEATCGNIGCSLLQFDCGNGQCIPLAWQCDTDNDCNPDGPSIDEQNCVCNDQQYKCDDGAGCYSQLYRCDSIVDCNDQSDESARYCSDSTHCDPDTYHQCDNGDCIFLSWRCDTYPDCTDGSDERDCNYCDGTDTLCLNGSNKYTGTQCVPLTWVCDEEADCTDGSDELGCFPCQSNPCQHDGVCVESGGNFAYTCECLDGTTGTNCQDYVALTSSVCDQPITPGGCQRALRPHYTTTRLHSFRQGVIGSMLTDDVLARFDQCSNGEGSLFVCSSEIAGCQDNGLPILPCKHLCQSFTHSCAQTLSELAMDIDCDRYPDKSIYPDTVCVMSLTDTSTPAPAAPVGQPQCEAMKHDYCLNEANRTIIPNLMGQNSQSEAYVYIDIIQRIDAQYPTCHEALQLFTCSVLAPACHNSTHPVLPCRSLCEEVMDRCVYDLQLIQMPLQIDCDSLPDYNQDINNPNCVMHDSLIPPCRDDEFTCRPGACLPMSQRCDGMPNCPDASDEADCPVSECNSQQYHCKATGRCIPLYWKCDGYADCVGGDDEAECATVCSIQRREFSCHDNVTCLHASKRCDLINDCPTGEDEDGCDLLTCGLDEFRCNSGRCIPNGWRCDGASDCPGTTSEDERDCVEATCTSNQFRCSAGGYSIYSVDVPTPCISISWMCDGEEDCTDDTDEANCATANRTICSTNPCENGASCYMQDDAPVCSCPFGYSGRYCQNRIDRSTSTTTRTPSSDVRTSQPVVYTITAEPPTTKQLPHQDLPDHNCTNPLDVASSCHHYLPWTQTSSSLHIQSLLSGDTENLLASLSASQCYNMSQMFVCATRYPACQANGFPLLPCRHVCELFMTHCSHVLALGEHTDLLAVTCDAFVTQSSSSFSCLSENALPPRPANVTAPVQHTCETIDSTLCSATNNYTSISLPNHFGQTSQSEAGYIINMLSSLDSTDECKQMMLSVGCALTYPKCSDQNTPLPPCRTGCHELMRKCSLFLDHYNFVLPVDCESFPDSSDPAVCIPKATITTTPPQSCPDGTKQCLESGECVSDSLWCNTQVNCRDASDEEHCDITVCGLGTLKCNGTYTECIPMTWRCDGFPDCSTGTDEHHCNVSADCQSNMFTCPPTITTTGHCIPTAWKCDGMDDCHGGSQADESDCNCDSDSEFRCTDQSQRCISSDWVCDDFPDCDDMSDEVNCPITTTASTP